MNSWFRFYHEALDDPKVQTLPPPLFKTWVNMLCLAARTAGVITPSDIPFAVRLTPEESQKAVAELKARGLLESRGKALTPHNWSGRQYTSDSSTERVRRFRETRRNVSETFHGNGSVTVSVTPPDTDTDTDQKQNRAEAEQRSPETLRAPALRDEAFDVFAEAFKATFQGAAYLSEKADFVQLARMRKANGIAARAVPDGWDDAVRHYMETPLKKYTLAHLASEFAMFRASPQDRYGKPTNHRKTHESTAEIRERRNAENIDAAAALFEKTHGSSWH